MSFAAMGVPGDPAEVSNSLTLAIEFDVENLRVAPATSAWSTVFRFDNHLFSIGVAPRLHSQTEAISASCILVAVQLQTAFSGQEFCSTSDGGDPVGAQALMQFTAAMHAAVTFVESHVDHLRIELSQPWLASSANRVRPAMPAVVIDEEFRTRTVPFGYGPIQLRSSAPVQLDDSIRERLIAQTISGVAADFARTILADAQYLSYQNDPDIRLILLLSAVSCEVKIKETLRLLAVEEQKDLVDLLIGSPRDFSLAAATLFDSGLRAVSGRSLREDDRDLYNGLSKLYQDRNAVAHRGRRASELQSPGTYLSVAERVFQYLDSTP